MTKPSVDQNHTRLIAFYLPQYHPIPENDAWWGKGFTEWANVAKARPLFRGHYQPHIPADLGFYDLRVPETRIAQAEMAREYGIEGFCYYHYWFEGHQLLERPFNEVLVSGKPDFPFCLCWANHNWTRKWIERDQSILIEQRYSMEDDLQHIRWLISVFKDPRYIKINGKPLFMVLRTSSLPDAALTAKIWREEVMKAGLPGLYLIGVLGFDEVSHLPIGFDAVIDFQPNWNDLPPYKKPLWHRVLWRLTKRDTYIDNRIRKYSDLVHTMMNRLAPEYKTIPCVTPSWDNTARRTSGAIIFTGSTPELYGEWLRFAMTATRHLDGDERIVFINAWNEWAEGNHLEPDQKWGRRYLEETRSALEACA